jgi:hypothetical protein
MHVADASPAKETRGLSMGELATIRFEVSSKERAYTGQELRPHFLLQELGLKGSGIGVFTGACHVKTEHLVDWEDRLGNDRIEAVRMLHFIGEFFGMSLNEGVLTQRFFMATLADVLNEDLLKAPARITRKGDDLFAGDSQAPRKLSVSIVTASPVSVLLHVGINIDPGGAPVPAVGLKELAVDPDALIRGVKERFLDEWNDMKWACTKVRPVV